LSTVAGALSGYSSRVKSPFEVWKTTRGLAAAAPSAANIARPKIRSGIPMLIA
jgi:hypothetical protein